MINVYFSLSLYTLIYFNTINLRILREKKMDYYNFINNQFYIIKLGAGNIWFYIFRIDSWDNKYKKSQAFL